MISASRISYYSTIMLRHRHCNIFNYGLRFAASVGINVESQQTDSSSIRRIDAITENENVSPGLSDEIRTILLAKREKKFTISKKAPIADAIAHLVEEGLASSLALDDAGDVAGIFTARDILKAVYDSNKRKRPGDLLVKDIITRKEKLLYCSPKDTLKRCREMMSQAKIRNVPVIENGEVLGIITSKDVADAEFSVTDLGGKKGFIDNVTGRKGLPEGVRLKSPPVSSHSFPSYPFPSGDVRSPSSSSMSGNPMNSTPAASIIHASQRLSADVASYALPHPYKSTAGVEANRRLYGPKDLCVDMQLCEDAHFIMRAKGKTRPVMVDDTNSSHSSAVWTSTVSSSDGAGMGGGGVNNKSSGAKTAVPLKMADDLVYMCVADGVGSWRQYGVDPRQFSHRIVSTAQEIVRMDSAHQQRLAEYDMHDLGIVVDDEPIHPFDVIVDAWSLTVQEKVVGSSTLCVAILNSSLGQLSYSNVGDCGLMVVRHIDSAKAGYMRDRQLPRHMRTTDLKIAYLSQQQLRSFNLPYQLGFSDLPDVPGKFEVPGDADTASIPLMPGDIILAATDGLFDNLDLDEIVSEISEWEKQYFPQLSEDLEKPYSRPDIAGEGILDGDYVMRELAKRIVEKARNVSLDTKRDSPFAALAKENDIMWGGGMPDDTTVLVARVYKSSDNK